MKDPQCTPKDRDPEKLVDEIFSENRFIHPQHDRFKSVYDDEDQEYHDTGSDRICLILSSIRSAAASFQPPPLELYFPFISGMTLFSINVTRSNIRGLKVPLTPTEIRLSWSA